MSDAAEWSTQMRTENVGCLLPQLLRWRGEREGVSLEEDEERAREKKLKIVKF